VLWVSLNSALRRELGEPLGSLLGLTEDRGRFRPCPFRRPSVASGRPPHAGTPLRHKHEETASRTLVDRGYPSSPCGTPDVCRTSSVNSWLSRLRSTSLGSRGISAHESEQLLGNEHVTVRNPSEEPASGSRRLLIGRTDGGRALTLVIERTLDPTTWLMVTGWESTDSERKILDS
jgi:hypothetical protein